jgi:hypothetical protein
MDMEVVAVWDGGFRFRGTCPHCDSKAAFETVSGIFIEDDVYGLPRRVVGVLRCNACNEYILGILRMEPDRIRPGTKVSVYEAHYPMGKPPQMIPRFVPEQIIDDFNEALRCEWVKAYKSTVLMCRRALQVSCDMEKAVGRDLFSQIDDLAQNQRITKPLKRMAHRIRLLGKKGAHADYSDIDATITAKDADDAITFMEHYLQHVYVLPGRMDAGES